MKYNAFESRCIILYFISPSVEVLSSIHAFSEFFSESNLQRRPVAFCLSGGLQRSCSASGQPRSRNGLYVHSFSRFDTSFFHKHFSDHTDYMALRTNEQLRTDPSKLLLLAQDPTVANFFLRFVQAAFRRFCFDGHVRGTGQRPPCDHPGRVSEAEMSKRAIGQTLAKAGRCM